MSAAPATWQIAGDLGNRPDAVSWVGANTPTPAPVDESKVEAGVIGLAFFVVMGAVVVALVFSMRRHLGRIDVTRHARGKLPRPPGPPPAPPTIERSG